MSDCAKCAAWAQYQGDYDFKCNCKKVKEMPEYQVVSDNYINELFEGTNFGATINSCVKAKRKQLVKTLRDQIAGYWSGHTAYHIAVNGGFLKDAKTSETKQLTPLGVAFLQVHDA